jgi:hypothetical protein
VLSELKKIQRKIVIALIKNSEFRKLGKGQAESTSRKIGNHHQKELGDK